MSFIRFLSFLAAVFTIGLGPVFSADDTMSFRVKGGNPGGVGGYAGEVTLTKLSKTTATVHWVSGPKKAVTDGMAIKTDADNKAIGTGYGPGLYALAVYELKGKRIKATWALATKPEDSGTYELKGSEYEGALSFADGTPGTVTFTPRKNGLFKVVWDLPSDRFEGIGLRAGNVLVAASGDLPTGFGIGAYGPKGEAIEGLWATTKSEVPGTEVWTLPESSGGEVVAVGDGKTVKFGGETYELKENKSAAGQATSELREYLRKGEDWDGYRKMVALRMQNVKVSAATLARATLEGVHKEHPDGYVQEIEMEEDTATIFFIIVKGSDAELSLFRYQKTGSGISSAQFVMRNKPPYESQRKFKAEQDKQLNLWLADLKALSGNAAELMEVTAGKGVVESVAVARTGDSQLPPELVKAIEGDIKKCAAIAQQFISHLQAGNTEKAVGLINDNAFTKVSREAFVQTLQKSNGVFGALKACKPDKGATDFGVQEGVMTFTLQADSEYANAKVRETLKFIRNDKGGIEFIGYNRTAKK